MVTQIQRTKSKRFTGGYILSFAHVTFKMPTSHSRGDGYSSLHTHLGKADILNSCNQLDYLKPSVKDNIRRLGRKAFRDKSLTSSALQNSE